MKVFKQKNTNIEIEISLDRLSSKNKTDKGKGFVN